MQNKPIVAISQCLEFAACRFNGGIIRSESVANWRNYFEVIEVCPEVAIGLGVPRNSIRLTRHKNLGLQLEDGQNGKNYTEMMNHFCTAFASQHPAIDGFILKAQSPSCGLSGSKVYPSGDSKIPIGSAPGLFAQAMKNSYADSAFEDENRLRNLRIADFFLTRVFTFQRWRNAKKRASEENKMKYLVDFHSQNKYLFMAYNQKSLKTMGQILANLEKRNLIDVISEYDKFIGSFFKRFASTGHIINVFQHYFGYFSELLTVAEKEQFLTNLEKYRQGVISILSLRILIQSYLLRFDEKYLLTQTFNQPYPFEMLQDLNFDEKNYSLL